MRLAMTIPVARRSAIRIPRRDLVTASGDTLRLLLTFVERDEPGAPAVDVAGIGPQVRFLIGPDRAVCDYGIAHRGRGVSIPGVVVDGTAGRVDIVVPRGTAERWAPRAGWALAFDDGVELSTLVQGVLHVRPGTALAATDFDLLTEADVQITDDNDVQLEA